MNCPNCKKQVEGWPQTCPFCGQKLLSREEMQKGLKEFKDWAKQRHAFFSSTLDLSVQGRNVAAFYIDNVYTELRSLMHLLDEFTKVHQEAIITPTLFQDKEWRINVIVLLSGIFVMMEGAKNEKFSQEVLANPPHGCQGVYFELNKIRNSIKNLCNCSAR